MKTIYIKFKTGEEEIIENVHSSNYSRKDNSICIELNSLKDNESKYYISTINLLYIKEI